MWELNKQSLIIRATLIGPVSSLIIATILGWAVQNGQLAGHWIVVGIICACYGAYGLMWQESDWELNYLPFEQVVIIKQQSPLRRRSYRLPLDYLRYQHGQLYAQGLKLPKARLKGQYDAYRNFAQLLQLSPVSS